MAQRYVSISLKVFKWNFVEEQNGLAGSFDALKSHEDDEGGWFPSRWSAILINPELIDLYFRIHNLLLGVDTSLTTGKCIYQLAGIKGPVFTSRDAQVLYLNHLLGSISVWIKSFAASFTFDADDDFADELLTISKTVKRTLSSFPSNLLPLCNNLEVFLAETGGLTLICLHYVKEDISAQLETGTVDALEILLDAWASLALDVIEVEETSNTILPTLIRTNGLPIFRSFLESKLLLAERDCNLEEDDVDDRDDSILYSDQLLYMGTLGRLRPEESLELVNTLLVDRIERLEAFFKAGVDFEESNYQAQYRESLNEHIHWLILISGYLLCDAGDGELPLVPRSLLHSTSVDHKDYLLEIPNLVLRLWRLVTVEPKSALPFADRNNTLDEYSLPLSHSLLQTFSEAGNGFQAMDFISDTLVSTFALWDSEERVLSAVVNLIDAIASRSICRRRFMESNALKNLLDVFFNSLNRIPSSLHRFLPVAREVVFTAASSLVKSLATLVTSSEFEAAQNTFFGGIFGILKNEIGAFSTQDRPVSYQDQKVKTTIMNAMDLYEGLALAVNPHNSKRLTMAIVGDLPMLNRILDVYQNTPDVFPAFLRLQSAFSKLLIWDQSFVTEICTYILRVFQTFVSSYAREMTGPSDIELLGQETLFITDTFWGIIQAEPLDQPLQEFISTGLAIIVPLIGPQLLQFPKLCVEYIRVLSETTKRMCGKVVALPAVSFTAFMGAVKYGTDCNIMEAQKSSYDTIASVCQFLLIQRHSGEFIDSLVDSILEHLLSSLLFKELDLELIDAMADAFLYLILVRQAKYQSLIEYLLSQQTGESLERLQHAFTDLNKSVETVAHQSNNVFPIEGRHFRLYLDSFKSFLTAVRSFMRVL
ncbi:Exportin-4 [Phlyctochytrium planicorne]|nr:Exportin-4 [Phlyctochytrium planicorne]